MDGLLGETSNQVAGDGTAEGRSAPERRAADRNGTAIPTKRCRKCDTERPLTSFSPRKWKADGLHSQCKGCVARYMRERYARDAVQRPKVLAWNERNRRRNRESFEAWIADKSCVDCGTTERRELTLDHIPGRGEKRANVSEMVAGSYGWPAIEAEIAKCEVRCFRCHGIMGARRQGKNVADPNAALS